MLEPCDGKLSCTVLRGEWSRKAPDLPDMSLSFYAVDFKAVHHAM